MLERLEMVISGFKDEFRQLQHEWRCYDKKYGCNCYVIVEKWFGECINELTNFEVTWLNCINACAVKMDFEDAWVLNKCLGRFGFKSSVAKKVGIPYENHGVSHELMLANLEQIGAEKAHLHTKGKGSLIAIIDSGVDYTHPELREQFSGGIDIVNNVDCSDVLGHGTHVAGIVCGKATGVAPEANYLAVKVLNDQGYGSEVDVIMGIEWAVEHGAQIINLSLGSKNRSEFEENAIRYAIGRGVQVVAAAGNDGVREYFYPASYESVYSIAAVDSRNLHANFSNENDRIALCAPGVNINSSYPKARYAIMSGTSMACPHVAGVFCLIQSQHGNFLRSLSTAQNLGDKLKYGFGLVRADMVIV